MAIRTFFHRLAPILVLGALSFPGVASALDLTQLLMSKVGVTQPQAIGGAGSIFKLAQAQMTAENFQKIAAVVPSMGTYLGAAQGLLPQLGTPAAAMAPAGGGVQDAAGQAAASALAGNGFNTSALTANAVAGGQGAATYAIVGAAPATPSATELMAGKAAQMLDPSGKLGAKLKTAEALAPAFEKLGMNKETMAKFVPVVSGYLKTVGGKSTSKLLSHALGM